MNPPQTNHFDQPFKTEDSQVSPMCCCYYSFTEESFFKFLNIWDVVFFTVSIVSGNIEQKIISIITLVLAIISLVLYCKDGNYGSCLHKVYAIVRLVFVMIDLILIIAFGIIGILALTNASSEQEGYTVVLAYVIISFAIMMPILLISINWSFLLKKVVYNKASSGVTSNPGDYPAPGSNNQFTPNQNPY